MNKGLKLGIEVALGIAIVVLGYVIYETVMVDIRFDKEK